MVQAIMARRDGDAFQARVFWRKAIALLDPESPVTKIGFEVGPKGFDDIWVEYSPPLQDQEGKPLYREHLQCKWHVQPGDYGYDDLIKPKFINTKKCSLLQRALEAQRACAPTGEGVRFSLVTNWRIRLKDPLKCIVNQRSQTLRLDRFFGAHGKQVRELWQEHLGLNDHALRLLVRTLSLSEATDSLYALREWLDQSFRIVGLRRVPLSESSFFYDDIVFQWLSEGRLEHDRDSLMVACEKENLLTRPREEEGRFYGVKSFERAIDRLEERCASVLNLVPQFNDRQIKSDSDWNNDLYPKLKEFLVDIAQTEERLRLILDSHLTLSFAAGSILDIKLGKIVELEQRTIGKAIWTAEDAPPQANWPQWVFEIETLGTGNDVVVAISLTHEISNDVRHYIENVGLRRVKFITAKLNCNPSAEAVICGRHAFNLVDELVAKLRAERGCGTSRSTIHLFIAGPNGFSFFLGQRYAAITPITLYEYDFEGLHGGSYECSLSLPVQRP